MPRFKVAKRGKRGMAKRSHASSPPARAGRRRKSGCLVVSVLMILAIGVLLVVLI